MISKEEVQILLDKLETSIADELESQQLDFKQWITRSFDDNIKLMLKMAVCMANGGGGSVVFGVADKVKGRSNAILGVPEDVDTTIFQKRIYEKTDPHLTPVFEDITVPEGSTRLLLMNVFPGMPPYTTTDGSATIRQGKDCIPYTGSLRRKMMDTSTQMDFTDEIIHEDWQSLFSHSAMERVREIMSRERVDESLLTLSDEDLLRSIGALKENFLTKGALLLVGKPEAISKYIPQYKWSFRKMISDTDYSHRDDGTHAIPVALYELERYIAVDNPMVTVESGLVHPEFSTYPTIALREALLNAFGHRDYRMNGTIMLKQYKDKLILTNPGEFVGGITPKNILHHPPVARNNHLMDLLDRLKLVNRSNLGVSRIFRSLLIEGKEPPIYREVGSNIELTFISSPLNKDFKNLINHMAQEKNHIDVDHLLILQYLIRHEEIDTSIAAEVAQRSMEQARELLSKMQNEFNLLESIGRGKGRYFTLSRSAYKLLKGELQYERQQILDKEAVKIRILSILKTDRSLTNKEIRQLTGMNQKQVQRLVKELEPDGVKIVGKGAGTKYIYSP
ncbi:RNA-binding domain-containing protein [Halalkalibacter krulwichiae]|uniref:Divergent AAA domain protein n=1 Tax=Halalkalibacter krulwichiae TaxID=199441 RepID=A0A1X9M8Z5_9BACI|nr:RNA-binding domain-containing protein [Halalkalibacter krulwichiae]ARK28663.1 Divergent AAA domain protein [Halalkalibacter krulwichiae]